jgi:osmoprotectant transport system substrate-binding protein
LASRRPSRPCRICCKLDNETIRKLNEQVDVKGEPVSQVVTDWMTEQGFLG